MRKCSSKLGEWEDAGDIIAREKTSQVLRDAIQARKSFSNDAPRSVRKNASLPVEPKRKSPPPKVDKAPPVQQSFQQSQTKQPVPQWGNNPPQPLAYRTTNHVYSPAYSSMHHPYKTYGRTPVSGPGTSVEDAPNFSSVSLPYQYPVTPTSSSAALSTARKRPRYSQESPLIQGYHQYPYPTPIRNVNPPSSPLTSTVFSTPTNTRSLPFAPPNLEQNKDVNLSSLRRIASLPITEEKYPAHEMAPIRTPPRHKSKVPPQNRSDDNPNFDSLLRKYLLSFFFAHLILIDSDELFQITL